MPGSGRGIARIRHQVLGAHLATRLNSPVADSLLWPAFSASVFGPRSAAQWRGRTQERKMLMPETPSPTRATISEESGTVRISIPMRRDWGELIFLAVWLGFWIFLARSSFHAAGKDFGPAWLGLWILAAAWVLGAQRPVAFGGRRRRGFRPGFHASETGAIVYALSSLPVPRGQP